MSYTKIGLVFFFMYVVLSVVQRMLEGAELSTTIALSTVLIGMMATVMFVGVVRVVGK
ncbi:hypothetical protein [Lysobacter niastensis]|uniref:Uncharacterized protein n=1 Tax=Lysobacter niastensis TaxID=380629 RepID=A0ABS0B6Y1_9GAMM|nr:hypothetical protein [Lysobacter niastensis]MBF6024572.1 hypothetical protein [Lysobacter niastensis]